MTGRLEVAQDVSVLLLELARHLQDNFARHAQDAGLTTSQAKVLVALEADRGLPLRALAQQLGFDPSNLTGPVDQLEARGFVERRPDPADRRAKYLVITAAGAAVRDDFWTAMASDVAFLDGLRLAELRQLRDHLRTAAVATRDADTPRSS
jgi:DNA-binding MarR family transcriptional regulator